jgi:hypothetical protein
MNLSTIELLPKTNSFYRIACHCRLNEMRRVNIMLSDSSSFPQLSVIHSEHKMDVIKVEHNSEGEDDPSSSHHQGELINTNTAVLPLALSVFRVENQVNISG